jgi:hypothetical protein
LYFYNARWYDPVLSRFAQADSIIPRGAQGYDRYAYVNNSPINYTDPTGHKCVGNSEECMDEDGKPINGAGGPDRLDRTMLKRTDHGEEVYDFYLRLYYNHSGWWWKTYGADGHFSAWDFIAMMYGYELGVIASDEINYENAYPDFREAMVRNSREFCKDSRVSCDPSSLVGAFMHLSYYSQSAQQRAKSAVPDMYELGANNIDGGTSLVAAIHDPAGFGHPEWNDGFAMDRPYAVGNGSLFKHSPRSWLHKIGGENGDDPAYILTGCQWLDAKGFGSCTLP